MTQQHLSAPTSADDQAARVAEEHRLARETYARAKANRAVNAGAFRDQLALGRAHAAEAVGR